MGSGVEDDHEVDVVHRVLVRPASQRPRRANLDHVRFHDQLRAEQVAAAPSFLQVVGVDVDRRLHRGEPRIDGHASPGMPQLEWSFALLTGDPDLTLGTDGRIGHRRGQRSSSSTMDSERASISATSALSLRALSKNSW